MPVLSQMKELPLKNAGAFHLGKAGFPIYCLPWPSGSFNQAPASSPFVMHTNIQEANNIFRHASACQGWEGPSPLKPLQTKCAKYMQNTYTCMQKDTHRFNLKCPECSMWAFSTLPALSRQWLRIQEGLGHIYLFILNPHVSHFPRRNRWLSHSIVAVTPCWKEVWSKAAWPDLGKHFHWKWTYCLSKGYSHRVGAADHVTPE